MKANFNHVIGQIFKRMGIVRLVICCLVLFVQFWFLMAVIISDVVVPLEVDRHSRKWTTLETKHYSDFELICGRAKNVVIIVGVFAFADFLLLYPSTKRRLFNTTPAE